MCHSVHMQWVRAVIASVAIATLTACSEPALPPGATVTISWLVQDDRLDNRALAETCSTNSGGQYRLEIRSLPRDATTRTSQLTRRLLDHDPAIDVVSIDTSMVSALDSAQVLAPMPADLADELGDDLTPLARQASTVDGRLVAAPYWMDPMLLWYRAAAAQDAGITTGQQITWDDVFFSADRVGGSLVLDDLNGLGVVPWVDAAYASAGQPMLAGASREPQLGLDSSAGQRVAAIAARLGRLSATPVEDAVDRFSGPAGAFLLAGPSVTSDPGMRSVATDLQWNAYPVIDTAAPPVVGQHLAVGVGSEHRDLAFDAIECLTSQDTQQQVMITSGHASARPSVLESDEVAADYPMLTAVRDGLDVGHAPSKTPYWSTVAAAIEQTWSPLSQVSRRTPARSEEQVRERLAGGLG